MQQERKHRVKRRWSLQHMQKSIAATGSERIPASRRTWLDRTVRYLRRLTDGYMIHQCSLMACACAYCALMSLVPMLIVGIAALGFVVGGSNAALHQVIVAIKGYVPIPTPFLKVMLEHVLHDRKVIGLFGISALLFAAHQTFLAMEPAMNMVWGVAETRHWFRQRVIAFAAALYTIVLLGADLAATGFIAHLQRYTLPFIPSRVTALFYSCGLALLPMLLMTLLFVILYRSLPARPVPIKAACVGAVIAALLWELTKVAFGIFVVYVHSYDRLYGSLSSLVILVVWAYYSMAILLLGAEIAADYEAMSHGVRAAVDRAHTGADLTAASGKEANALSPQRFPETSEGAKEGVWGRDSANSGYRSDFADIPLDVTGDGKVDLVSMDYASGEIFWLENPGKVDAAWTQHSIAKPGSMETAVVAPFLGKNTVGILPNCGGQVVWYELRTPGAKPEWVEHVVGKEGAAHGLGWGDVNGDGKADIVTPHGWYENVDARNDKWVWHADWQCDPGAVGIGMPTYDFDGDGRNDIVFGSGHGYGLYWLQQAAPGSPQKWVQHPIDTSWSQVHTLQLASLERGGHPVVLTGKRYLAHDHDPGAREPLGIFYYKFDRKTQQWQKFVIDQGTHAGTGLQMTTVDLRRSGHMDIIAPGKSGLYVFENLGV